MEEWRRAHDSIFQNQDLTALLHDEGTTASVRWRNHREWGRQSRCDSLELDPDVTLRNGRRRSGGNAYVDGANHVATNTVRSAKVGE